MDSDIFVNILAFLIRFSLGRTFLNEYFQERPEISNPANSMVRVKEGVALYKNGINPYEGDTFHGTPILLVLFYKLFENAPFLVDFIFPICDIITAVSLEIAAKRYLQFLKQKENTKNSPDHDVEKLLITDAEIDRVPRNVKLAYLFNPFSIVTCVAHATTALNNCVIAVSMACMLTRNPVGAVVCVALAAYNDFYSFVLLSPIIVLFSMDTQWCLSMKRFIKSFLFLIIAWSAAVWFLLYISKLISNGWSFLEGTYGFILAADDLTPNPGLFWYFFTEMFDQFRLFFTWVFQLNPLVYVAPLTICLRDDPIVLFHQLLTIVAIFKSYPSVGDAALVLSFLPALGHLNRYIRHRFIIALALIACVALAPIMWYLWIHAGSANANFYFAVTLVYSTAHIFLLTDLLYAHLRRQVHLKHGITPIYDEKEAVVVLK